MWVLVLAGKGRYVWLAYTIIQAVHSLLIIYIYRANELMIL